MSPHEPHPHQRAVEGITWVSVCEGFDQCLAHSDYSVILKQCGQVLESIPHQNTHLHLTLQEKYVHTHSTLKCELYTHSHSQHHRRKHSRTHTPHHKTRSCMPLLHQEVTPQPGGSWGPWCGCKEFQEFCHKAGITGPTSLRLFPRAQVDCLNV